VVVRWRSVDGGLGDCGSWRDAERHWECGEAPGFSGGALGVLKEEREVDDTVTAAATAGIRWRFQLGLRARITSPHLPVDSEG
jgi:hypothetical protein